MRNKRMSFKRLVSTFMVMVCLCVPSLTVFAQTDEDMLQVCPKCKAGCQKEKYHHVMHHN